MIAVSVGVRDGVLVADHMAVQLALQTLLGDQWDDFVQAFPRRRDLVPASQAFAAAAGFGGGPGDVVFGVLPRLVATLDLWADAVEATLAQLGVDYRDRYRFDEQHRRRLTLRQINIRLKYATFNNPLAIAQNDGKLHLTGTELLLMDLFEATTRTAHPSRPLTPEQKTMRVAETNKTATAIADYRKRHPTPASRKQAAVATARANAQPSKGN